MLRKIPTPTKKKGTPPSPPPEDPGTRPGGIGFPAGRIGDRGDREIVYVPNVYVPFPAPI